MNNSQTESKEAATIKQSLRLLGIEFNNDDPILDLALILRSTNPDYEFPVNLALDLRQWDGINRPTWVGWGVGTSPDIFPEERDFLNKCITQATNQANLGVPLEIAISSTFNAEDYPDKFKHIRRFIRQHIEKTLEIEINRVLDTLPNGYDTVNGNHIIVFKGSVWSVYPVGQWLTAVDTLTALNAAMKRVSFYGKPAPGEKDLIRSAFKGKNIEVNFTYFPATRDTIKK